VESTDCVGRRVTLIVSDPWEVARPDGTVSWATRVVKMSRYDEGADQEVVLLELNGPMEWRGERYRFVVARERHGHGFVTDLIRGDPIECRFIGQPDGRAQSDEALDTSWWRGGLAGRGTIQLGSHSAP
jgi:hypothetical protein